MDIVDFFRQGITPDKVAIQVADTGTDDLQSFQMLLSNLLRRSRVNGRFYLTIT